MADQFQAGQNLNGRTGHGAGQHAADYGRGAQPALPVPPKIGEGIQAQSQEAIYGRLGIAGQNHGAARHATERGVAEGGGIGRAPVRQQQPREACGSRKQAHVRAMAREEARKPVGQCAQ